MLPKFAQFGYYFANIGITAVTTMRASAEKIAGIRDSGAPVSDVGGAAYALIALQTAAMTCKRPKRRLSNSFVAIKAQGVTARELIERAKRDFSINERTLQRARERLGIVATKTSY